MDLDDGQRWDLDLDLDCSWVVGIGVPGYSS